MAYDDGTRYQYLESLDSARAVRPVRTGGGPDERAGEELQLQIFTEVLMTLALGREVVVPQSYAFDSFGFQQVAATVLRARDTRAPGERPFRVHLFGARSYEEAVTGILTRTADPADPFRSVLLPELNDPAAHGLDPGDVREQAASLDRLLNAEWLDPERAGGLALVLDEFRHLPRVAARPPARPQTLEELVVATADETSPMGRAAADLPELQREVHATLATAIRRLGADRPHAFHHRSRLRLPWPWPGDPAGRTPEEIVGGPETLGLLIEYVDTLYNLIVVDSIGIADTTLSTGLGLDDRRLAARATAQELALAQYRARAHPSARAVPAGNDADTAGPLFELKIGATDGLADARVRTRMAALRADAGDAIGTLLQARAERGRTAKSPFWQGVTRLRAAEDPLTARKALDAHLARVAAVLGDRVGLAPIGGMAVELVLTAAGAVGPAMATEVWKLPGLVGYPAMAAGAVGNVLYRKGKDSMVRRLSNRRLACALGRVVDVRN
ncbi:hypothetical protein ACFV4P_20470 [Kitasatospora sp. NPDC059795]|uniref:hypothetical protein n=1 Tax=Kitasatospora sp. NPDC059795 TaxID=3346949 RepID=UPI00366530F4